MSSNVVVPSDFNIVYSPRRRSTRIGRRTLGEGAQDGNIFEKKIIDSRHRACFNLPGQAPGAVTMLIQTSHAEQNGVKFIIYGRAGTGKTVLCATAPQPIILSAEGGLLSIRNKKIPYIEIKSLDDLRDATRWSQNSDEAKNYQTICVDSISEIAEMMLAHESRQNKDGRVIYDRCAKKTIAVIKLFRDIPNKNVYMTAKEEFAKLQEGGMFFQMKFPGTKLAQEIPYLLDGIFRLCVERGEGENNFIRYIQTAGDFQVVAKDRSDALLFKEAPNLTEIIKKMQTSTPET